MSSVLVLLVAIGVVLFSFWGCLYPYFYIQREQDYKEGNRVGYNMIPIRILCLPTYFIDISIDIIIYTLGSMPWSSEIFWMVD
jgi:hypothetical protein